VHAVQLAEPDADGDEPEEEVPAQTWMLATAHPSAVLRTPGDARAAAYDALVADLEVVAGALA
jgi:DNA polymerase